MSFSHIKRSKDQTPSIVWLIAKRYFSPEKSPTACTCEAQTAEILKNRKQWRTEPAAISRHFEKTAKTSPLYYGCSLLMAEGTELLPKQTFTPALCWKTNANLDWPHSKYSTHVVAKFSWVPKKNNLTSSRPLKHTANGQVGYSAVRPLCVPLCPSLALLLSLTSSPPSCVSKPGGGHFCSAWSVECG